MKRTEREKQSRKRLLCYYGDDFTGSTDVLEALFRAGLRTILFLEPPAPDRLEGKFRDADCFGVAGVGRSLSPEEMERDLRPLFETLRAAGSAVVHYKVCSTFDSSPRVGSIGKAAEIGRDVFGGRFIPVIAGVPYLKRYTLFGHHYAGAGDEVYRIDRHPTMSQHPVTPMKESDLRLHLAGQTELRTGLFDIMAQQGDLAEVRERLGRLVETERPELVLFDVLDDLHLETVGRLLWEEASRMTDTEASATGSTQGTETATEPDGGLFVIGSSGVEYALTMAWRAAGRLIGRGDETPPRDEAGEVSQLLVVSGSCSPVTERQLQQAIEAGYAGIRVPAALLVQADRAEQVCAALKREALEQLAAGRSVLLYSAAGPQDSAIGELREQLAKHGRSSDESSRMLGSALGVLARELVREAGLTRIVVAGGDTSGYVTRELGIYALECVSTLEPGGPICRAHSTDPGLDGLELALKGGQVGSDSFFEHVRLGRVR